MRNIVLSICIPTYNRKNIVKQLVEEILKSQRTDLEVVVLDNASNDGTYEELKKIKDKRFKLYSNERLITAVENGHKALKLAKGKYCMLFNDREIANYNYLDEILDFLKKDIYSFVYFYPSKNKNIKIFEKGIEAKKNISYSGYHPTGLTYNRELLEKVKLEEYIEYEKVNFYPNFFISYDIVHFGKMAIYSSKFWRLPKEEFLLTRKSKYVDLSKPAYFTPENKIDRLYKFSNHIFLDNNSNEKIKKKLLLKAFIQLYCSATYEYVYSQSNNKYLCNHYGVATKDLNFNDYLRIGKKFRQDYIKYLNSRNYKIDLKVKIGILEAILGSLIRVGKQKIKKVLKLIFERIKNEKL